MKRIIAVLLSFLLIFSLALSAVAANVEIENTGDKTVIISGDWAYEHVNAYGYEIDEYLGSETEVSLPWSFAREYVTTIGDYAFSENTTLVRIDTTSVLEGIGKYAFDGCTTLEEIVLYDSLVSLGNACFYGDSSLRSINLEDTSITEVPDHCFAFCGLSEVALPDTCTSIGNYAFYNGELTKITIPDSVTEISDSAFLGCENLVIYGYSDNSYAHEYAQEHGIDFEILEPETYTFILGDADGDGVISIIDATLIQTVIAFLEPDVDGMIALRGSSDGDELNIRHATEIQRYLAHLHTDFPVGTETTVML